MNAREMLKQKEFQKDKKMFYLLYQMMDTGESLFFSDSKNYIVGRGNIGYPTWIWTRERLEKESIEEITKIIKEHYLPNKINSFTCKKELYEELKKNFETENYFEMGYLECNKVTETKKATGFLDKPNYGDKILLAKFWQRNQEELYPSKQASFESCLEEVESWLEEGNFYIWRNNQGKAISMASYTIEEDMAKISHVYTPKEERKKGYATSLISEITKKLLEEEKQPLLYTDYHYKPSNHTYQKVGYVDKGVLINFKIKKEE